jgi:hypothetical protein
MKIKKGYKIGIFVVVFTLLAAIVLLFRNIYLATVSMNQAESVNQALFEIVEPIEEFNENHGRLPVSLEEIEQEKNMRINTIIKTLNHKFITNNDKYVFIVKVNDKYYCVIKNKKDNYQPAIIRKHEVEDYP